MILLSQWAEDGQTESNGMIARKSLHQFLGQDVSVVDQAWKSASNDGDVIFTGLSHTIFFLIY